MSSVDDRQNSTNAGVQLPGLVNQVNQLFPLDVEQLPFPEYSPISVSSSTVTGPLSETTPSPAVTNHLPIYILSPAVTRTLPEVHTGTLSSEKSTTTSLRTPVVIRGGSKKSTGTLRPPKSRLGVVPIAVISVILLLTLGTAFAVAPVGGEAGHGFNLFRPVVNLMQAHGGDPNLIAQQAAATATAVTHQDGYDPGTSNGQSQSTTGTGSTTSPVISSGGGLDRFAFGQCTFWANIRYHALTGFYVPWLGNAYEWAYGAEISGWVVSSTPRVPSIIVLQPGVQGASGFGHVAIVEHINSDGSVVTSNFNWYANGGWDRLSYWTFHPGPGVVFVWHP